MESEFLYHYYFPHEFKDIQANMKDVGWFCSMLGQISESMMSMLASDHVATASFISISYHAELTDESVKEFFQDIGSDTGSIAVVLAIRNKTDLDAELNFKRVGDVIKLESITIYPLLNENFERRIKITYPWREWLKTLHRFISYINGALVVKKALTAEELDMFLSGLEEYLTDRDHVINNGGTIHTTLNFDI
jgi:hypothetical protein